jgi:hypothetical protein
MVIGAKQHTFAALSEISTCPPLQICSCFGNVGLTMGFDLDAAVANCGEKEDCLALLPTGSVGLSYCAGFPAISKAVLVRARLLLPHSKPGVNAPCALPSLTNTRLEPTIPRVRPDHTADAGDALRPDALAAATGGLRNDPGG